MARLTKIAALAGFTLALSALPAVAQDLALPALDLDPFHIFTPAPPPPAAPTPAAAVVVHHHHHWHHHLHHHVHHHPAKP